MDLGNFILKKQVSEKKSQQPRHLGPCSYGVEWLELVETLWVGPQGHHGPHSSCRLLRSWPPPLTGPSGLWRDDRRLVLASALRGQQHCRADLPAAQCPPGRKRGPSAPLRLFVACRLHANLPLSLCRPVGAASAIQGPAEHHSIKTSGLWAKSICLKI